jgi:hypothetical protein
MKGAGVVVTTIPTMKAKVVAAIVLAVKVDSKGRRSNTSSEGRGDSNNNTCHKG